MTRLIARSLLLVTALLAVQVALFAQTERGTIRGNIQDPSGAVLAAAAVVGTNIATGVQSTTTSTESGDYSLNQLIPGNYTVTVEKTGFRKMVQENVVVQVSSVTPLDFHMQLGSVNDSVEVTATAPQLKSESSEVSVTINPKSYNDLPVNASGSGRSVEAFLYLTPGFSGNTFDAHINGSQTLSKELQIDGMSTVIAEVQGDPRVLTLPPDAIQEFAVASSSYPAEYGNTGGGVERYTVKSGTNSLHGTAYEFLRNDKLDARGFFNASRSVNRQNEYGASVGGPIMIPKVYDGRNRSFFFFNINYFKNRGGAQNTIASVPNAAFRSGDLSGLRDANGSLVQIYDPATTVPDGSGGFTRAPFVGNIIPQNRISPVSAKILSFVPDPKLPGVTNNYPASGNSRNDNRNFTLKFDQYLNEKHHLSGTFNDGRLADNGPYAALPHPVESSRDGLQNQYNARASYDWVISPTFLNHFGAGFNRQHQLLIASEYGGGWGDKLGIPGIVNAGFPVVNYGIFTQLAANQDEIQPISNTFLFADSITWVKGKHNMKFGVDYRRLQHQGIYPSRAANFNFSRNETAFPNGALQSTTGNEFASFLLGDVDNANMYINDLVFGARWRYFAAYAQDDYKLSSRLTLNVGLRWDLYTPLTEVADRYSIMDQSVPNPAAGNLPGTMVFAGAGQFPHTGRSHLTKGMDYKDFGPRIGFAWRPLDKFVLRGGYGISYSPTGALGGGNETSESAGYSASPLFQTPDAGITPAFNWNNGFPQNFDHPPMISAGLNIGQSVDTWSDNAVKPNYKQDWNLGTEYQLASNWLLDVTYVGSKGTRLNTGAFNLNQVPSRYLNLGNLLNLNIDDPAVAAAGFKAPWPGFSTALGTSATLARALRPFPQYTNINMAQSANVGNMTYHSLQAKVEKRFSNGLFLLSSYTWSKTLTDPARRRR